MDAKQSILFLALGLSLSGVGVATGSHFLTFAGVFTIAVTVRYRKRPPLWEYLAFLVLILVIVALVPPNPPLLGAVPLILSYVLDYIDERRRKRMADSPAALVAGTTHAEPDAAPKAGSAAQIENVNVKQGSPPVS